MKILLTRLFVLLLALVVCSHLWAQQPAESPEPQSAEPAFKEQPHEEAEQPAVPVWPKPFRPTQRIGADSQISLPTDI